MPIFRLSRHEGAEWELIADPPSPSTKVRTGRCQIRGCTSPRAGVARALDKRFILVPMYLCERCGKFWCRVNGIDYTTGVKDNKHE